MVMKKLLLFLLVVFSSLSIYGQDDWLDDISINFRKWNSLLTFTKNFGFNFPGWGLTHYGYINGNESEWMVPWVLSFENYQLISESSEESYFRKKGAFNLGIGVAAFKKLNGKSHLNFTFLIPIEGRSSPELGRNKDFEDYLLGLYMTQGIFFVPESDFGITFGVGIFERFLRSDHYRNDVGFKIEIGIKFL
jgi:hypothetical protein